MVLVDCDADEEERKLLLSDSVTASPVYIKPSKIARGQGGQSGAAKEEGGGRSRRSILPLPRLAWTGSSSISTNIMSDSPDKLRLGPAEEQFLAMAGGGGGDDDEEDDDCQQQVPECLQVVSHILSELDTSTDNISSDHQSEIPSESLSDTCTCQLPHHKLVVDVHQGGGVAGAASGGRCPKHNKLTTDRIQARCHSESDRQLQRNDQLDNCDRIETVGEDRCRHMSESALGPLHWSLGRRKRAATLASSPRNNVEMRLARHSAHSGVMGTATGSGVDLELGLDIVKQCRSTDTVGGDVKFDIWEEADFEIGEDEAGEGVGDKCDEKADTFDGIPDSDMEKNEFESSFNYTQHPLVAELYNCYNSSTSPGMTMGMSHSSSTSSMPICRICQLPSIEPHNTLISPCRCLGSIRYVHNPCLAKWLEVCSRKTGEAPVCELCQYQYIRHKKFVISNWRVPSISSKDKVLHSVFLMSILIMIICSVATILSFKQADTLPKVGPDTELSSSELLTLSCGVLFFFSFFVAMYVEVKAEFTIYQLICKFFQMNHEWTILEYDKARDRIKRDTVCIKGSFP